MSWVSAGVCVCLAGLRVCTAQQGPGVVWFSHEILGGRSTSPREGHATHPLVSPVVLVGADIQLSSCTHPPHSPARIIHHRQLHDLHTAVVPRRPWAHDTRPGACVHVDLRCQQECLMQWRRRTLLWRLAAFPCLPSTLCPSVCCPEPVLHR